MSLEWWTMAGTWVQAVGTVAAIVWALVEFARTRKDQLDQRKVETERARRTQAELVSAWVAWGQQTILLINASDQLIYEVVIVPVPIYEDSARTAEQMVDQSRGSDTRERQAWEVLHVLQPGRSQVRISYKLSIALLGRWGVELAFTDREGQHWIRRADGRLDELGQRPTAYFDLPAPVIYESASSRD